MRVTLKARLRASAACYAAGAATLTRGRSSRSTTSSTDTPSDESVAGCYGDRDAKAPGSARSRTSISMRRSASTPSRESAATCQERRFDGAGKPDAGNPHVRFDERRLETEPRSELRHRQCAKAAGEQPLLGTYSHCASRRLYCATPAHGAPTIRSRTLPRRKNVACRSPAHRVRTLVS